jgi:hypothetical protein
MPGCDGNGMVDQSAEICAGVVLAGQGSLAGAVIRGGWVARDDPCRRRRSRSPAAPGPTASPCWRGLYGGVAAALHERTAHIDRRRTDRAGPQRAGPLVGRRSRRRAGSARKLDYANARPMRIFCTSDVPS